jgi:enterobacterial common antigen flippase
MRTILTNLMQLAGLQLVLAMTGLVRNKVISVQLGTSGFGQFNLLYSFFEAVSVLVIFGLGVSLSRSAAAAKDHDERQKVLGTANFIIWALTIVIGSSVLLGAQLGLLSFQQLQIEPSPAVFVSAVLLLISLPLKALESNYIAFLTGIMDIKGMTSGRSVAVIAGTVLTVPVVWFYGFVGATIQYVALTLFLVILLGYRCHKLGYRPLAIRWHRPTAYGLAFFGVASLVNSFVQSSSDTAIRVALARFTDKAEVGLYQSALSLASMVKTIVLGSVGSYSLAALSKNSNRENIIQTANQLLKAVLPIAALSSAALGVFGVPALVILNTPEFIPAAHYFPFLLAANFVQAFIWVLGAPLLALKMVRLWLVLDLIQWGVRYAAVMFLLPVLGPQAVVIGYFAATVLHLIFNIYFYFFHLKFSLDKEHFVQLVTGFMLVFGCSYLGAMGRWPTFIVAGLIWLVYLAWIVQTRIGFSQLPQLLKRFMKGKASA